MKIYRVTVKQLVPYEKLTKRYDQISNPAGTYTFHDATDEEDALDQFHSTVPIGCLDDFYVSVEEVTERRKELGFLTNARTGQSFPVTVHHTPASEAARFDQAVDDATHSVITAFEWLALPEGDDLGNLMVRINDAITAIMGDFRDV